MPEWMRNAIEIFIESAIDAEADTTPAIDLLDDIDGDCDLEPDYGEI